jgi:hypothetical protein
MAADGFQVRPLDISIEEIDRLLVSGDKATIHATIGAQRNSVGGGLHPARARGGPVPVYTRGDLSASMGRPGHFDETRVSGASHDAPAAPARRAEQAQMQSTIHEAELEGGMRAGTYGAAGLEPLQVLHPALGRGYRRIEKVALGFGVVCLGVCGCAFMAQGARTAPVHGSQQLTMLPPFGCHAFLCPTSVACVESAANCPEGDPFLKPGGYYRELITCGGRAGLCDCTSNPKLCRAPESLEEQRRRASTLDPKEGVESCVEFVCPASGRCVSTPADCREGSPFAPPASLYSLDAAAARAKLGPVLTREVDANVAAKAAKAKAAKAAAAKAAAAKAAALKAANPLKAKAAAAGAHAKGKADAALAGAADGQALAQVGQMAPRAQGGAALAARHRDPDGPRNAARARAALAQRGGLAAREESSMARSMEGSDAALNAALGAHETSTA